MRNSRNSTKIYRPKFDPQHCRRCFVFKYGPYLPFPARRHEQTCRTHVAEDQLLEWQRLHGQLPTQQEVSA